MKRDVGGNSAPCIFFSVMQHRFFFFFPSLCSASPFLCLFVHRNLWPKSLRLSPSPTQSPTLARCQYQERPPELPHLIMIVNIDGEGLEGPEEKRNNSAERPGGGREKSSAAAPFCFPTVLTLALTFSLGIVDNFADRLSETTQLLR